MKYKFKAKVSVFNKENPWYFVPVPVEITGTKILKSKLSKLKVWTFLPIVVTIGKTTWNTSLLPLGKNSIIPNQKFIAIKKDVRKKEGLQQGDEVEVSFKVNTQY